MKEIERIKTEKVWQKGQSKEYYTELTDAIRTYIKDRFGFNALEMTSSEIIDQLLEMNDKEAISDLKLLFQTADLVKFAKHNPQMNENDANLINAIDFINETDLEPIQDKTGVIAAFFAYAQEKQKEEANTLIAEEKLNIEAARRYIQASLKRKYASENGTDLNAILPKMSPLNPQYLMKKQSVFQKIVAFIEKFKDIGGQI